MFISDFWKALYEESIRRFCGVHVPTGGVVILCSVLGLEPSRCRGGDPCDAKYAWQGGGAGGIENPKSHIQSS